MTERKANSLDGDDETTRLVRLAESRARRWRAVALATSGIAACLLIIVAAAVAYFSGSQPEAISRRSEQPLIYSALVTPEGGERPAMLLTIFAETKYVSVQPFGVDIPEGHALELWRVPQEGPPQSLGLIDLARPFTTTKADFKLSDTLAVSVEPPGGSPTGAPTGQIFLNGPLVEAR